MSWVAEAEPLLRNVLVDPDPAALLLTPRYWHLMDTHSPFVNQVIPNEVRQQQHRLETILAQLRGYARFGGRDGQVVVGDTNLYLQFQKIDKIPWPEVLNTTKVRLVLPFLVVEELDSKKGTGSDKMADRARQVFKLLEPLIERALGTAGAADVREGTTLEVLLDDEKHRRLPSNDAELVDRAAFLQQISGVPVTIMTDDTAMMTRAKVRGLAAIRPPEPYRLKSATATGQDTTGKADGSSDSGGPLRT